MSALYFTARFSFFFVSLMQVIPSRRCVKATHSDIALVLRVRVCLSVQFVRACMHTYPFFFSRVAFLIIGMPL